jgi:hypothetical protein
LNVVVVTTSDDDGIEVFASMRLAKAVLEARGWVYRKPGSRDNCFVFAAQGDLAVASLVEVVYEDDEDYRC